jgi:hypothetical protein
MFPVGEIATASVKLGVVLFVGCSFTAGVLPSRSGNLTGFTEEWRPYVAANLHFYSTLLACFLK